MKIITDNLMIPKSYEYENSVYRLVVYGEYVEDIGRINLHKTRGYSMEQIQQLNFDGGYVAFYTDKETNTNIIFRSHQDTFSLYYAVIDDTVYFTDDFYVLCRKFNVLTWNLNAISDYFENSWNNICKYDRSPFKEISRLDTWNYIVLDSDSKGLKQQSWKNIDAKILYTEENPEAFQKAFYQTLDYYLAKIHDTEGKVAFAISSGLDANTLAARYSQLYPDNEAIFVTSKIDDITDESEITAYMQSVLPSAIRYIPIDSEKSDFMHLLQEYMKEHVPPRFFNEINEDIFLKGLKKNGIKCPNVNGMNADGVFGEFGNEYGYLFNELMQKREWDKAKNVLTAIMISFRRRNKVVSQSELDTMFSLLKFLYCFPFGRSFLHMCKKVRGTKRKYSVLKVMLPKAQSHNVKTHADALQYAAYDGADRSMSISYHLKETKLIMPYGGYRFQQLKYACDPYISSVKLNKACLRNAVSDLLPKEILENSVKRGNPGVTLGKVMKMDNNKQAVSEYVKRHKSSIVNTEKLLRNVEKNFGTKDFLALSLIVFEDRLKSDYGIELVV